MPGEALEYARSDAATAPGEVAVTEVAGTMLFDPENAELAALVTGVAVLILPTLTSSTLKSTDVT
jgi:hypothetical protein